MLIAFLILGCGCLFAGEEGVFTEEEMAQTVSAKEVDSIPEIVRQKAPAIPNQYKKIRGTVHVAFIVDEKGNVNSPRVMKSTVSSLDNISVDAIRKWKFKPAKKGGEKVAVRLVVPMRFKGR